MMNVAIKYRVWLAGLFLSSMLGTINLANK